MPEYKLFYFPTRGRAEVIRMVFAVAEVPFEDIRIAKSDWSKVKPDMLCRQMPELQIDGVRLPESAAIYRYLAREYGLSGSDNLETAKIDAVCCVLEGFMTHISEVVFAPDEDTREKLRHRFQNEICGSTAEKLENMLQYYNPVDNFFVGDTITLADVVFFYVYHDLVHLVCSCPVAACLTEHPTLRKIYENCLTNSKLAEWLEQRPEEN